MYHAYHKSISRSHFGSTISIRRVADKGSETSLRVMASKKDKRAAKSDSKSGKASSMSDKKKLELVMFSGSDSKRGVAGGVAPPTAPKKICGKQVVPINRWAHSNSRRGTQARNAGEGRRRG